MKHTLLITLGVLLTAVTFGYSQKSAVRKVKNDYQDFSYLRTSEVLLEVAEQGYTNKELLQKLGNSFYYTNKMEDASKWYGELFELTEEVDPEYYFRYALALKGIGDYEASDRWMSKFNELKPSDSRAQAFLTQKDYLDAIKAKAPNIELENLEINTQYSEFGIAVLDDQYIFASSRSNTDADEVYGWNKQPYLDLFAFTGNGDDNAQVTRLEYPINTKFHESSMTVSKDGRLAFFSRNNYYKKRYVEDDNGTNHLQIYRAVKDEANNWDVTPVHFNSNTYSVSQPAMNADGTKLYFSSNMPGAIGQSDIYVATIMGDGTLGIPINLGPTINTEARESFPFVNANGDLYYATRGFPGLGGYDIFVSEGLDTQLSTGSALEFEVRNLGLPFNSESDDFAYFENQAAGEGFLSSNRDGGKGDDDIYRFVLPSSKTSGSLGDSVVYTTIKDGDTNTILNNAQLTLYNGIGEQLSVYNTGLDTDVFSLPVNSGHEYLLRVDKAQYASKEYRFTVPKGTDSVNVEIQLDRNDKIITTGSDLGKILDVSTIFFDYNVSEIRYDAEVQLQKLIAVLKSNPSITLAIKSHTDCRGTFDYNLNLSSNRAEMTRQYLINKGGIAADRLTAKGYGEFQLLNTCGCEPLNNSDCTEDEHQENRRSEFIIKTMAE